MKKHNLFKFYACIGIATLIAGLNLKHAANDYGVSTNAKLALQIIAQATTTGSGSTSSVGSSSSDYYYDPALGTYIIYKKGYSDKVLSQGRELLTTQCLSSTVHVEYKQTGTFVVCRGPKAGTFECKAEEYFTDLSPKKETRRYPCDATKNSVCSLRTMGN